MMNNEKYCDLHLHSYYSDGTCSPTEVVSKAKSIGISPIALTDHNTVKGLDELLAEAEKQGIEAIAGIEFSVDYRGKELHLLAYGISKKYFAEIEEKMDECRGKYLEAMDRGDATCTFYVGTDLALSIALMSEFSEIYRVEHDDDNRTVIVHLDEFPEEETFEE